MGEEVAPLISFEMGIEKALERADINTISNKMAVIEPPFILLEPVR